MRGWETIFHANGYQKKSGVAILISNKLDFKPKNIIRDEEGTISYSKVLSNKKI